MKSTPQELVESYRAQQASYDLFGRKLQQLLDQRLAAQGITIHSITYRVKDPATLQEKLTRPGKNYERLADVTDLLGLRIVTYFADDVDRVVALIDQELQVDEERSVDKRPLNDPDRFGYSSVHRVCRLRADQGAQPEYQPVAHLQCEIQIRSILQHAWAEIEHDLGYKAAHGIPVHLRRRFSMLAGLLELADDQFMRLRDDLTHYSDQVQGELQTKPEAVTIDNVSLASFIQTDPLVQQLDREISTQADRPLMEPRSDVIESRVAELLELGVTTIKQLRQTLADCQELVRLLADQIYQHDYRRGLPMARGTSLLLLVQVLIGRLGSEAAIRSRLDGFGILSRPEREERARLLQRLVQGA